jgi:hypothetical protein
MFLSRAGHIFLWRVVREASTTTVCWIQRKAEAVCSPRSALVLHVSFFIALASPVSPIFRSESRNLVEVWHLELENSEGLDVVVHRLIGVVQVGDIGIDLGTLPRAVTATMLLNNLLQQSLKGCTYVNATQCAGSCK